MDLDQMKEKWMELDRKMEMSIRLNRRVLEAVSLKAVRSRLQRLLIFTAVHALAWACFVIALGSSVYEWLPSLRTAFPAAAADLYAIGMSIALIRQMSAISEIDYGQPVTVIQRQVEALRILRVRTTQWAVLAGIVVWAPFLIVTCQWIFGADAIRFIDANWLVANILFGLALIPAVVWASRKFGGRIMRFPFIRSVMRDLAGSNLNAAAAALAALSEFEEESAA